MSTRAIAPVVGVSQSSIRDDLQVSSTYSPAESAHVNTETGEVSDDYPATSTGAGSGGAAVTPPAEGRAEATTPRPSVIGIDGKTYPRPPKREESNVNMRVYAGRKTEAAMQGALAQLTGLTESMSRLNESDLAAIDDETRSEWDRDLDKAIRDLRTVKNLVRKGTK